MSKVTDTFREHHRELANQMSGYVAQFEQTQPSADAGGFVTFLKNELVPHAVGEEAELYPLVDELVRAYGKPTATMHLDHEYIQAYVARIEATAHALADAAPEAQHALRAKLAQLGTQVQAIFELHLAKEERVYLPLVEQYVDEDAQRKMLDRMHAGPAASNTQLDVRMLPPAQRHTRIFQNFNELALGDAFELVNDHDPKPLYYQFAAEHDSEFTWDYIERGPQVWRVRIGKTFTAGEDIEMEVLR